jgi:hypothetical protein
MKEEGGRRKEEGGRNARLYKSSEKHEGDKWRID